MAALVQASWCIKMGNLLKPYRRLRSIPPAKTFDPEALIAMQTCLIAGLVLMVIALVVIILFLWFFGSGLVPPGPGWQW